MRKDEKSKLLSDNQSQATNISRKTVGQRPIKLPDREIMFSEPSYREKAMKIEPVMEAKVDIFGKNKESGEVGLKDELKHIQKAYGDLLKNKSSMKPFEKRSYSIN